MIFTSISFLAFFLIIYSIYWLLPSYRSKKICLLFASMFFYASWNLGFFLHFLLMIVMNYWIVLHVYRTGAKKYLVLAVVLNLINLGFFKYFYFFTEIVSDISGLPLLQSLKSSSFKIILPLAISFYTFQILAFTVDVYRKKFQQEIGLFDYTVFIMFFPQLIAGPIMRPEDFIPQLKGEEKLSLDSQYKGMFLIGVGVIKKVLIADNLAFIIDPIWVKPEDYSGLTCLLAFHAFSWQIYCDFSGYTDIARGVAFLLGYQIPENFKAPFLATSPSECWQRWHITLSSWMRDYIYIPLGGSRVAEARHHFNTIVTFTLGGLWHGASWNFVIWGFYHGCILSVERLGKKFSLDKILPLSSSKFFGWLFTYHIFIWGAGIFRTSSMGDFLIMAKAIFANTPGKVVLTETVGYLCFFALLLQIIEYKNRKLTLPMQKIKVILMPLAYLLLIFLVGLLGVGSKEFVYFQF
ncbi:MAG: MBOAT family O-acyltransferase [Spirochaetota bacterium]